MEKCKTLLQKICNRETLAYLCFGVLTTLVNFVVFKLFDLLFAGKWYLVSNSVAWVTSVAFAFVVNKLFVFESRSWSAPTLKKEIPAFFGARVASYFMEQGGLWFFVEILHFDEKVFNFFVVQLGGKITAKLIIGVAVVIVNYLFSKLYIFRKKKEDAQEPAEPQTEAPAEPAGETEGD